MVEELLANLGIRLPAPAAPLASYIPVRLSGDQAFVSGQIPMEEGKVLSSGKLGAEVSIEQGQEAARRCALQALAVLRQELGSLDRVKSIVKVDGSDVVAISQPPTVPSARPRLPTARLSANAACRRSGGVTATRSVPWLGQSAPFPRPAAASRRNACQGERIRGKRE